MAIEPASRPTIILKMPKKKFVAMNRYPDLTMAWLRVEFLVCLDGVDITIHIVS